MAIDPGAEKTEKHAMGSVADKIAKKIAAQGRSKVIDLAAWREGKEIAREAGLDDDRLAHLLSRAMTLATPYTFLDRTWPPFWASRYPG